MLYHAAWRETTRVADRDLLRADATARRRQIADVQHIERREREALSVRRRPRTANLRHGENGVVDRIRELREWSHLLIDVSGERNRRHFARRNRHAPDLAVETRNERSRIRRECRAGIDVAIVRATALRVVALHVHDQPPVFARGQIAELEPFATVVPHSVDKPLAVRARHRTKGAVRFGRANERLAALAIELPDLILAKASRVAAAVRVVLTLVVDDVVRLLGYGAGEECARHVAAHVHPEEARIGSQRGAEVLRGWSGAGRRGAVGAKPRQSAKPLPPSL